MRSNNYASIVADIFSAALQAVNPNNLVKTYTEGIVQTFKRGDYRRFHLIAFGKAACPMAKAIEDHLNGLIDGGVVITKYGHCGEHKPLSAEVVEAGHPIPDQKGVAGTERVITLLADSDRKTLVVCLVSGGGSALLVSPYDGIVLAEKQRLTESLLKAGATIHELNTVRKHISRVKGGRLAEVAYPARVLSLILSDVIGDRLDVIASGPTAPDETTYEDSLRILNKYGLTAEVPKPIIKLLTGGREGLFPETPKKESPIFEQVENIVIGNNKKALEGAKDRAESLGFRAEILSSNISGEAREAGKELAKRAANFRKEKKTGRPRCIISGGETTVTVKGRGLGGRNMELALSFAMEIEGIEGVTLLSAGTDGTDGPTDAAGAIVDGKTVEKARAMGLDPEKYLDNNDTYNFFRKIDMLHITGPTGTNVMDIQIMIIES